MKKILNILFILILFSFFLVPVNSFATDIDLNKTIDPQSYQDQNSGIDAGIAKTESFTTKLIANFFTLYKVAGVGIAIILLMVMGAKFMWGSVEQKAEVKKHFVVYITGAFVFFGSAVIVALLQDFIIDNLK